MATTIELIEQAEENVAQLQAVLERTQQALSVAEHVDNAARRTRPILKWLLIATLIGALVVVVRKVMSSDDDASEDERR